MTNYQEIRFSEDGTRAILKNNLGNGWACCKVEWTEPNMATLVATIKDYGTTYNIKKANEWLVSQEIELFT